MLIINKYVTFSIKPSKVRHVYSILMLRPVVYWTFFVAFPQNGILAIAVYPSLAATVICQAKAGPVVSREGFGLHFWEVNDRITSKVSREKGVGTVWLAANASPGLCLLSLQRRWNYSLWTKNNSILVSQEHLAPFRSGYCILPLSLQSCSIPLTLQIWIPTWQTSYFAKGGRGFGVCSWGSWWFQ